MLAVEADGGAGLLSCMPSGVFDGEHAGASADTGLLRVCAHFRFNPLIDLLIPGLIELVLVFDFVVQELLEQRLVELDCSLDGRV